VLAPCPRPTALHVRAMNCCRATLPSPYWLFFL
jgi:hypothetical protein